MENKRVIEAVSKGEKVSVSSWEELITDWKEIDLDWLFSKARGVQNKYFSNKVYVRGLIELTNYCKNNCLYCGIRRDNNIERYRLSSEEVMASCRNAYEAGFRTFVIQGGEDLFFTEGRISSIIKMIKTEFQDCALTLIEDRKSVV